MAETLLALSDPDLFADGIPYDGLARLRAEAPLAWVEQPAGPGFCRSSSEVPAGGGREPSTR